MPAPASSTRRIASGPSTSTRTVTGPPGGVNFSALPSRLLRICSTRVSSASIQTGAGAWHSIRCPRALSAVAAVTRRLIAARSIRRRLRLTLPVARRVTSSRSSTRRTRCCTWRAMMARASPLRGSAGPHSPMTCSAVVMAPSGLRSSWPSMAKNSSLARLAASAWAWARSRSASARLRSRTSSPMPTRVSSGRRTLDHDVSTRSPPRVVITMSRQPSASESM